MALIFQVFLLVFGCWPALGGASGSAEPALRFQPKRHQPYQFQFAGYYAAQVRGHYQQENLAVTIKPLLVSLGVLAVMALWVLTWNLQLRRAVRRRTAELQAAQQQLVYHVANSPLAVIEWDHAFRVARWTGQAEQVFGWSAAEVLGKHPAEWRFVYETDRALGEAVMSRLLAGEERRNVIRNRNYRKDGSVVECEWYNSCSLDEKGRVNSVFSLVLDVTSRVHAEAALRKSEEKFRAVFEQAAIGIGRVRFSDATWIDANDAFCRMLGYTQPEMQATPWPKMTHPEDVELDLVPFRRLAAGEIDTYSVEKRFIHKQGHAVWARLTLSLVRDDRNRPDYEIAIIEDITQRKAVEEAVRQNEQHFRALAQSVPQLVWRTDRDGQVDYVNERWQTYTGQTSEEARGSGWTTAVHPEDRDRTMEAWARATARGTVYQIEYRLRRQDGVYRWFLARGVPLKDSQGRIHSWFGTSTDIDEQRRTLETLRESEQGLSQAKDVLSRAKEELERRVEERTAELRGTIAELEQMSYSMIHDLRAPLRAIQSFGGIVAEDPENRLTEESRELIEKMRAAAGRMDHLIRDMLNYGRVVRGELPLEPIDVGPLVRGIVETYPNLQAPGVQITVAPEFPKVVGNSAALTQCLSQLLGNAVKFSREAARPIIQVRGEAREPGWVRITVEDNGVGIAPEVQAKLFGIFQQLKNTGEGTGMGLAIVRKAVERMGGRVGVQSEVARGSRFWIELKSAPEPATAEVPGMG